MEPEQMNGWQMIQALRERGLITSEDAAAMNHFTTEVIREEYEDLMKEAESEGDSGQ